MELNMASLHLQLVVFICSKQWVYYSRTLSLLGYTNSTMFVSKACVGDMDTSFILQYN